MLSVTAQDYTAGTLKYCLLV